MIEQYSISINNQLINKTFSGSPDVANMMIAQLIDKMSQSGWEVQKNQVQEGIDYKISMTDSTVNKIVDRILSDNTIKGIILTKIFQFFNKDAEDKMQQSIKDRVEKSHIESIEKSLFALANLEGIYVMKGDKLLIDEEHNRKPKLKM